MEVSKEKCGRAHQDISAIGETIAKKDSVFNSTRTETNMKVCGPWIKNMVKALTGEMMEESSEENTQEIGLKTKSMEEELSTSKIVTGTMDIG